MKKNSNENDSRHELAEIIRGEKGYFVLSIVGAVFAAFFSMLIPVTISVTVDSVIDNKPFELPGFITDFIERAGGRQFLLENLYWCAVAVLVLAVFGSAAMLVRTYCSRHAAEGLAKNLRDSLMEHYQSLDFAEHNKLDTGDIIQRCTTDVEIIRTFAAARIIELARGVAIIIIAIALMSMINIKMMLATASLVPIVAIGSLFYFRIVQKRFLEADEAEGELSSVLQENVSGVRVVRAFGRQKDEIDKFNDKNLLSMKKSLKLSDALGFFWGSTDAMGYFQVGISLGVGTIMMLNGDISTGELILFVTYAGMLVWPVRQMGRILSDFGKAKVSWGRLYDILKRESENMDGENEFKNGDIVFDNVCFGYDDDHEILHDISFTLKSGQTLAILGETGSGKSTLVQLLIRLYDPSRGRITIGGVDLSTVSRSSVRRNIALILQESFLYSRTLKENISIARADATDEMIDEAADIAALTGVVNSFSDGYSTEIGEKGITLSGGQKQRVAIARSVLRDTPVIILDDSLSAVDTKTDAEIRHALKKRNGEKTTIIISHRIGTLMQADLIAVIANGRITQLGTCDELLREDGLFADMFGIQTELRRDVASEDAK